MTTRATGVEMPGDPPQIVLARLGVALLLSHDAEDGTIVDADGMLVVRVDRRCVLNEADVERIALLAVLSPHRNAGNQTEEDGS